MVRQGRQAETERDRDSGQQSKSGREGKEL
jgi:hypothetical protein